MRSFGLFDLTPPYGAPGAFGASPYGIPIVLTPRVPRSRLRPHPRPRRPLPGRSTCRRSNSPSGARPGHYGHDGARGNCLNETNPAAPYGTLPVLGPPFVSGTCSVGTPAYFEEHEHSYLTLPTTPCAAPLSFSATAASWQGGEADAAAEASDGAGHAVTLRECRTHLTIPKVQLTSERASSGTGLVFNLAVNSGGGILNPAGIARPAIRNSVVTLPEGLTIDPSLGSGLGVCTEADFAREGVTTAPGAGCPATSKIGKVEVQEMLGLPEPLDGAVFLATPYANPFHTLIALYMVARNPRRGLFVRSAGQAGARPAHRCPGRHLRRPAAPPLHPLHAHPARRPARRPRLAARLRALRHRRRARLLGGAGSLHPRLDLLLPDLPGRRRRRPARPPCRPSHRSCRPARTTPRPAPTPPSTCT